MMNNQPVSQMNYPNITSPNAEIAFTDRELLILRLIAHEYSDKEIGGKLFLSHHTIHTYRKKLMLKLKVSKSTGLVRRGFELGLLVA